MKNIRLILGAVLAPATVPLLYFFCIYFWSGYTDSGMGHREKLMGELLYALFPMSYLVSLPLGGASVWLLSRIGRLDLRHCVVFATLMGAMVGLLGTYVFVGPSGYQESLSSRLIVSVIVCIAGGITSLAFCLIARIPLKGR